MENNPELLVDILTEHFIQTAINEIFETIQNSYSFNDLHIRLQYLIYSLDAFQGLPQSAKEKVLNIIDSLTMQVGETNTEFCITLENSQHGTLAQLKELGYTQQELNQAVKLGFYWKDTGKIFLNM